MKLPYLCRSDVKSRCFTLVELLVVMGIIAILASVILSIGPVIINMAKRAKAANMANQIQTACLNYYTEYSIYPVTSDIAAGADAYYSTNDLTHWENLSWALCGNVNVASITTVVTPTVSNTRGIAFLNLKTSDCDSNGVPENPISPTGSTNYFNIAINSSYSGILGTNSPSNVMPNFAGTWSATGGTSTAGIAVWANCNPNANTTNQNFWVHTY